MLGPLLGLAFLVYPVRAVLTSEPPPARVVLARQALREVREAVAGYRSSTLDEELAGAAGFLLKDAPSTELAKAIHRVMQGERVVDPDLAAAIKKLRTRNRVEAARLAERRGWL